MERRVVTARHLRSARRWLVDRRRETNEWLSHVRILDHKGRVFEYGTIDMRLHSYSGSMESNEAFELIR